MDISFYFRNLNKIHWSVLKGRVQFPPICNAKIMTTSFQSEEKWTSQKLCVMIKRSNWAAHKTRCCYFDKNSWCSSATILNTNKMAKMAFNNLQKKYDIDKKVCFPPKINFGWTISGGTIKWWNLQFTTDPETKHGCMVAYVWL